jgi:hypothetical protein
MPTNTYTPLANITLTGTDSEIVFANIPNTYRDLILVANYRPNETGGEMILRLNSDTGTNYFDVFMYGNGSSPASNTLNLNRFVPSAFVGESTSTSTEAIFQFMDYSVTNKHKTVLMRVDTPSNGTKAISGRWANTNAINTITFGIQNATNYALGSTFSLYGVIA